MNIKFIHLVTIACFVSLFISCKSDPGKTKDVDLEGIDISTENEFVNPLDTIGEGLPIFYNMYLSVELTTLFETSGAVFTKDILNSVDNTSNYLTSSERALNLGVYAVDLSYARAFDQLEVAGQYFRAMQAMSEQLGIPTDYFESTARRFEKNIDQKDSLIKIANEIYIETEDFLNENERYATGSLIILGGWIEAIYIGSEVVLESKDAEIIERLAEQKYSLENLSLLLNEHKGDEVIDEYLGVLSSLKSVFENLEVEFSEGFDPESEEGQQELNVALQKVTHLRDEISKIRDGVIN